MKHARPTVLYAAAVRDATGVNAAPGAVLVQGGLVVAAGERDSLPIELVEQAEVIDRPNDLVLPAFVNAHTHLELTDIGPQPYNPAGGFVGWVKRLRSFAPESEQALAVSASHGVEHCISAGIQAVGDIAHSVDTAQARFGRGLGGVSYLELFGLGPPHDRDALEQIDSSGLAFQPHAPYSAGPAIYDAAARSGLAVSTHLAETREESEFVAAGEGPWLDYLQSIGRWDDAFAEHYGQGRSPVQWMKPYLEVAANDGGWLVAHCNDVSDEDLAILADSNTSVAYCPIASEYFGHKDHRYRDMLSAGVNVCLGTDSIVGTDPNDPQPLGLLSAMRRLYERDHTDPATLLAMATTHGARALRLNREVATLQPGAPARFACLPIDPDSNADPLIQVLSGQGQVEAISFEA